MHQEYFVYILASGRNGTLYVGVTRNLLRRVWEHREGAIDGFTKKYGVKHLVHFEVFDHIHDAMHREKRLKKWKRRWKLELIEKNNSEWADLYDAMTALRPLPGWLTRTTGG